MLIYQMFFNNIREFRNFVANLVAFSCSEQEEIDQQILYSFLPLLCSSVLFRREEGVSLKAVGRFEASYAM